MPIQTPLLAVLPAFCVSLIVLLAAWRPWQRTAVTAPVWLGAGGLALAIAYILADRLVSGGWPGLWPAEEHRKLPMVAAAAFVLAPAVTGAGRRIPVPWQALLLCAALLAPVLWVDISVGAKYPQAAVWWFVYAGAAAMLWTESAGNAQRAGGARVPLVMCLAAAGAALTIIQSYTASIGFMAAALAAAMGPIVLLGWWKPDRLVVAAALPVYSVLLLGLLISSTSTGVYSTILTILSAATAGLADRGPFKGLKPVVATALCAVVTLALAAASLYFTPKGFDFGEE